MVMRVGGLATGMDIEGIVNKLMEAERMPLDRMQQEKTLLEWKRDGFREINRALLDLDNMMLDMKLSTTYNPKSVSSTQDKAVTATATTSATNGSYEIAVTQLAENEMQVGEKLVGVNLNEALDSSFHGDHTISTYKKNGEKDTYTINIKEGDTLRSVLEKISRDDNNVRAFFDEGSQKVVFETTRTGVYNVDENGDKAGNEIEFDFAPEGANESIFSYMGLDPNPSSDPNSEGATVKSAQNAEFTYNNGLTIESKENNYSINGINLTFNNVTEGNARLTVATNVDEAFDKIKGFIDKYNKAVELMNTSQTERKKYDYKPLLEEQKEDMTESQIEKWEKEAKSGILRGETVVQSGLYSMRQSWYSKVETDGEYSTLSQIGITTSPKYLDGGQLVIDEDKLRKALSENPEDVHQLFSNSAKDDSRGLINRFEDSLNRTKRQIEDRAGKDTHAGLDDYSLGKRMKDLNSRISDFERNLFQVEQRYWNQFTQMEKAIARLNDQSAQLFSQFG